MMLIGLVLTLSIFAMGVLGNEGLGWFASNDRVTANDMGITVNGESDIVKSVEYFKIESISLDSTSKYNIYTFKDDVTNNAEERKLDTFSTLVAERQLLIKITLQDGVGAVRVTAASSATEYIADATPDISIENNSLSSVVEFYSISGAEVSISGDSYVISSQNFQGTPSRFSEITPNGNTVTTSFTQYIPVYETEGNADEDVIYIIVDYYEDAAEHVMDTASMLVTNGMLDFGEDENKIIGFIPDFTISVVKIA